jgi:hypothetical protein
VKLTNLILEQWIGLSYSEAKKLKRSTEGQQKVIEKLTLFYESLAGRWSVMQRMRLRVGGGSNGFELVL